ncbi:MAG: phage holin family protein [Flavobacteriaceae bacterium]|jgi:putative membrane protein|nr:phage holin family protein [Flavobacteriaceae bacterium]
MKFILKLLITGALVVLLSKFLPGVGVDGFTTALWVAFVLGLLDAILKPVLVFLTLPATIITLGLFLFVINAVIILIGTKMVDGFTVSSFWTALLFSIVLTFCQSIVNGMLDKR